MQQRKLGDGLRRLRACDDAQEWASNYLVSRRAYASCQRIDWLTWLADAVEIDVRALRRSVCAGILAAADDKYPAIVPAVTSCSHHRRPGKKAAEVMEAASLRSDDRRLYWANRYVTQSLASGSRLVMQRVKFPMAMAELGIAETGTLNGPNPVTCRIFREHVPYEMLLAAINSKVPVA